MAAKNNEPKVKRMIRRDHPELSEKQIDDIYDRLDQLADILFDDWLAAKQNQKD